MPEFFNISVDKCLRRIGGQSKELEDQVAKAEEYLKTSNEAGKSLNCKQFFENVLQPIEVADSKLFTTWGLSRTLYQANDMIFPPRNYFAIHSRARRASVAKYRSRPIYETIQRLQKQQDSDGVTAEQKHVMDEYVKKSKVNGLDLTADLQEELDYRSLRLTQEQITYESKIHVANEHFFHTINDYGVMQSFPSDFIQHAAADSKNPLNGPWKVRLLRHTVDNFLTYCPDRELRWNIWKSDTQKASRQVRSDLDNGIHIEYIRDHRARIRELLGYKSHAEMRRTSLDLLNAENPEAIHDQLRKHAKPKQQQELETLSDFASQNGSTSLFEEYDVLYWNRKYNIAVNRYDANLIQEYFPINTVFTGLFDLAERLFSIKIKERSKVECWNRSTKFFDVFDTRANASADPIGGFFLDPFTTSDEYPRYEQPNGFVIPIREHSKIFNSKPLLSLVLNFSTQLSGKSHTLKLDQVATVFGAFGQLLMKLLNESNYREVAGLTNVSYVNDHVCYNVFRNLLFHGGILKQISKHVETSNPLTDEHIQAIQTQKLTLAGYNLCTELFKSSLDLELSTTDNFWLDCLRKNYSKFSYFPIVKTDARICSMFDVVMGNWSGCYYGSIYSEMLAADIYKDFENALNKNGDATIAEVGQRFRQTYLSVGSNMNAVESFKSFSGREPSINAYVSNLN